MHHSVIYSNLDGENAFRKLELSNCDKHCKGKSMPPIGEITFSFVGVMQLIFACQPTYLAQNFFGPH